MRRQGIISRPLSVSIPSRSSSSLSSPCPFPPSFLLALPTVHLCLLMCILTSFITVFRMRALTVIPVTLSCLADALFWTPCTPGKRHAATQACASVSSTETLLGRKGKWIFLLCESRLEFGGYARLPLNWNCNREGLCLGVLED
ncbi:hypothetical protein B0H12DRAFT_1125380 [Mycena haematopus]|nr:hypothetical protein B0H12DRAFT_1125380 [Mycena haematopus]